MTHPGQRRPPMQPNHGGTYPPPEWEPPAPKRRKWPWVVGGIFGFIVLLAAVSGPSQPAPTTAPTALPTVQQAPAAVEAAPEPEPARPEPTVIKVSAMADEFEANQLAAEKKWGGQYIQFTAPVGNINSYSVSFTDVTTEFSLTQVSCRFEDENAVLKLAKGKPATVRGIVGDDQLLGVIGLEDCEIVG